MAFQLNISNRNVDFSFAGVLVSETVEIENLYFQQSENNFLTTQKYISTVYFLSLIFYTVCFHWHMHILMSFCFKIVLRRQE